MTNDDFHALIPAGGAGSRLWPISRRNRPKFLYDFLGSGRTMIQSTFDRLAAIAGADHVSVITGVAHEAAVRAQLPDLDGRNLFCEPVGRDSTAAIALPAAILANRYGRDCVIGSFAADHVIRDDETFGDCVREAVAAARVGYVTTIGIAATRPSTAFGYIRQGESLADRAPGAPHARVVKAFVEKPDAATAAAYLDTGEYRWNAGMFVMKTGVLLDLLKQLKPEIHAAVTEIASVWDGPVEVRDEAMERIWPGVEKIAFDYAVAEPLSAKGGVAMVPGGFGWDDIGDFNSVAALIPSADAFNNKIIGDAGKVLCLDSAGNVIAPESGRMVAMLGADDLVVIDTPDALLVAPRARSQEVKRMVAALATRGEDAVL
ncbi:mannose-1-phosphate guanylyltransferase [Bifidobacterium margollesii]|uniref:Mannose-1-phosphate guanylyltransferase n=1 Tax=Bifidobacterium margollesii TaxID=2020964 RepID=A0A2N5JB24_9BIFI|nr:mannose-1-phosphate guanylyltransferase [Bifidobacterium margollesii]PLS31381.1 mannose-1-phosphate guanylyltransferase [Bifidobacterium margollesii]